MRKPAAAYLRRLSERYKHDSPDRFSLWLKMHHAAKALAGQNMPVKQAAERTGSTATLHFSRVFHALGIPSDFRGVH